MDVATTSSADIDPPPLLFGPRPPSPHPSHIDQSTHMAPERSHHGGTLLSASSQETSASMPSQSISGSRHAEIIPTTDSAIPAVPYEPMDQPSETSLPSNADPTNVQEEDSILVEQATQEQLSGSPDQDQVTTQTTDQSEGTAVDLDIQLTADTTTPATSGQEIAHDSAPMDASIVAPVAPNMATVPQSTSQGLNLAQNTPEEDEIPLEDDGDVRVVASQSDRRREAIVIVPPPPRRIRLTSTRHAEAGGSHDRDDDTDSDSCSESDEDHHESEPDDIVEDLSVPDEEELKEIESAPEVSALAHEEFEKSFFTKLDDPEHVPAETGRIHWTIPRVHGTRSKPNQEAVLRSPPVLLGGYQWRIKFYPKGNHSDYMSAYIECSKPPEDLPTGEGEQVVPEPATSPTTATSIDVQASISPVTPTTNDREGESGPETEHSVAAESSDGSTSDNRDTSTSTSSSTDASLVDERKEEGRWYVAAQFGLVMYNPDEPRVNASHGNQHQFCRGDPDWGWTRFHKPHEQAHVRVRGQRQPMIRNDTVAFTAYIRIVRDETEGLWSRSGECSFDTAGVRCLSGLSGETGLGHLVTAVSAWTSMKPFRHIINSVPTADSVKISDGRPKNLVIALQCILHRLYSPSTKGRADVLMVVRHSRSLGLGLTDEMDVVECWEILRRRLEVEMQNTDMGVKLRELFDGSIELIAREGAIAPSQAPSTAPLSTGVSPGFRVSVVGTGSVQAAVAKALNGDGESPKRMIRKLPKFLQLELERQRFDPATRRWKKLVDRMTIDENIDLQHWTADADKTEAGYSLFGFIAHKGDIRSGRYYPVVRPRGPGTRWLANLRNEKDTSKLQCLTDKQVREMHHGVAAGASGEGTETVPYVVMYVRNDTVRELLDDDPAHNEGPAATTDPASDTRGVDDQPSTFRVLHSDLLKQYRGKGLLDMYDLPTHVGESKMIFDVPYEESDTVLMVQKRVASMMEGIEDPLQCQLWVANFEPTHEFSAYYVWREMKMKQVHNNRPATTLLVHVISPALAASLEPPQKQKRIFLSDGLPRPDRRTRALPGEVDVTPPRRTHDPVVSEGDVNVVAETQGAPHGSDVDTMPIMVEANPPVLPPVSEESETDGPDRPAQPPVGNTDADVGVVVELTTTPDEDDDAPQSPSRRRIVIDETNSLRRSPDLVPPRRASPPLDDDEIVAAAGVEEPIRRRSTLSPGEFYEPVDAPGGAILIPNLRRNPFDYLVIKRFDRKDLSLVSLGMFRTEIGERAVGEIVHELLELPDSHKLTVYLEGEKQYHSTLAGHKCLYTAYNINHLQIVVVEDAISDEEREACFVAGRIPDYPSYADYVSHLSRDPLTVDTPSETRAYFGGGTHTCARKNGFLHGPDATFTYPNGDVYRGTMASSERHGHGTMTYAGGDVYGGDWSHDSMHGDGTMVYAATGNTYTGGFKKGRRHGKGVMYFEVADEEMELCQICYEEEVDGLFYDCGHVCACMGCAKRLDTCPVCRRAVKDVVRVYHSR